LKRQPDSAVAVNNLAFLLAEKGEVNEAEALAQKAVRLGKDNPEFLDTMGWVYLKQRRSDAATGVFSNLVQKYPSNAQFRYHYGASLLAQGDRGKAKSELNAALQLKPNGEDGVRIQQLLQQIR